MDHGHFDDLTRSMAAGAGTRRALLRRLAGVTLGVLVARLTLDDGGEAKPKHAKEASNAHREHPRRRPPERPAQAHAKASGGVQSEGKHKGKGKGKGNGKHHPPPPPSGVCDNGHPRCPDGSCTSVGQCCPGSRRCDDGFCYKEDQCCPEEWQCADGSCVPNTQCCAGEKRCAGGECVSETLCCSDEKKCGGDCIPKNECCELTYPLCDRGCNFIRCVDGEWECQPRPFGDYCLMPWYDPGICCKGQCTRTHILCELNGTRINPDTCGCEEQ
jgi:hypothetical protein